MNERLSLTNDGVEMIDYPDDLKTKVEHAAEAWRSFIALPDDAKGRFAATSLQAGVGYEKKGDGSRESRDIKENFDITKEAITEFGAMNTTGSAETAFIDAATTLFDGLSDMIRDFGIHVEAGYGIKDYASLATASADKAFVRFLWYPPSDEGRVIGEPHVDHSGFTFHLYESTGGCDRLTFTTNEWLPMPVETGKAAAFCSMQSQLISGGELTGLCHRILANDTTATIGRIAIVCFVPLVGTPAYDRKTHGRLQDMVPGFNYAMAPTDFEKLFKATG